MAKRGGQPGNSNASKGREWAEALRKELKMYENKGSDIKRGQALRRIAKNVVELAIGGNKDAIQEIGNRLDGKPHQSMDVVSEHTETVMVINASPEVTADEWLEQSQKSSGSHSPDRKPH